MYHGGWHAKPAFCCSPGGSDRAETTWKWRGAFSPVGTWLTLWQMCVTRLVVSAGHSALCSIFFFFFFFLNGKCPASGEVQSTSLNWADGRLPFLHPLVWSFPLGGGPRTITSPRQVVSLVNQSKACLNTTILHSFFCHLGLLEVGKFADC